MTAVVVGWPVERGDRCPVAGSGSCVSVSAGNQSSHRQNHPAENHASGSCSDNCSGSCCTLMYKSEDQG